MLVKLLDIIVELRYGNKVTVFFVFCQLGLWVSFGISDLLFAKAKKLILSFVVLGFGYVLFGWSCFDHLVLIKIEFFLLE